MGVNGADLLEDLGKTRDYPQVDIVGAEPPAGESKGAKPKGSYLDEDPAELLLQFSFLNLPAQRLLPILILS